MRANPSECAHAARPVIGDAALDLAPVVHHERTVGHNGLTQRLSAENDALRATH